jgi:hypothetical protein
MAGIYIDDASGSEVSVRGGIPVELLAIKGQIAVRWVDATDADFTLPFLKDTINRQMSLGRKQALTLADELEQCPARQVPSAFIFHMSRCGSTLASRMLATVDRFHVVSEPACISDALSLEAIDQHRRETLLSGLINALAPEKRSATQAYFLKLTSWNIFHLALFRKLYPSTPWIFIYRNPEDVLASHARAPAAWRRKEHLIRRCSGFGVRINEATSSIEKTAQILACVCSDALQNYDPASSLLLNYEELPAAMYEKVAKFLQLELCDSEIRDMHAVSLHHAKDISRLWRGERPTTFDPTENQLISKKYLAQLYEQLQLKKR